MSNSNSCNGPESIYVELACRFINKIKTRFRDNPLIYKSFLDIFHQYVRGNYSVLQIYMEVSALFVDHPDLVNELNEWLPDTDEAPPLRN